MAEEERRSTFLAEKAKFATQREVTLIIFGLFAVAVVSVMMYGGTQAERSTILQTIVALALFASGYWLGSSKAASDAQNPTPQPSTSQPPKETQ